MSRRLICLAALAASAVAFPAGATAATINVEIKADQADTDDGDCALREAVRSANEAAPIGGCTAGGGGSDTIRIPAGVYPLTIEGEDNGSDLGDLDVSGNTTFVGLGKGATIDAEGVDGMRDRIFDLRAGNTTIRNVTITRAYTTGGDDGGGIRSAPGVETHLFDVTLLLNEANGPAATGGGIFAEGPVRITESLVQANSAPFDGGIGAHGGLTMRRTLVRGNTSAFSGAVFAGTDPATISDSAFVNNELSSETGTHQGAGFAATQDTDIRNTTFYGNRSVQGGGALAAFSDAEISLTNVTVTNNTAEADGPQADFSNPADGGGLYSQASGNFVLRNTVVAGNFDLTPAEEPGDIEPDCSAQVIVLGNNLIGDEEGCAIIKALNTAPELDEGTNPLFGAFALQGGPTPTVALRPASPLRNRVLRRDCNTSEAAGAPRIRSDQRGVKRPQQKRCDVGAYEFAKCGPALVNRVGTGGPNRLRGTADRDGILGLGGKDRLAGRGGKDGLCGAAGGDKLAGGGQADKLIGGPGRDRLNGGPGKDVCIGGPGKDVAVGCEKEVGV